MGKWDNPRGIWRVVCRCGWKGKRQLRNLRIKPPCRPKNAHKGDGDGHHIIGGYYLHGPKRKEPK